MKTNLTIYKKLRATGCTAHSAMKLSEVILDFAIQESRDRARIIAEPEQENYFDVYGEPDTEKERRQIIDLIESNGLWYVAAQVKCPYCNEWHTVDSIGMIIDSTPENPFTNPYVIDLMGAALGEIERSL